LLAVSMYTALIYATVVGVRCRLCLSYDFVYNSENKTLFFRVFLLVSVNCFFSSLPLCFLVSIGGRAYHLVMDGVSE